MRLVRELAARLRQLLRRRREDAETEMELRFHLEMEAEKNLRAGLPPREAQRQAHVRLGGTRAIREAVRDARGTRPLEDLIRDLGYALRAARRSPVFTLAAVVSLAIPIGFNTTIFTVVDAMLFRPLPVVRPAQLVDVWTGLPEDPYTTTSYPDYLDLRAENDVFTDMAAHAPMAAVTRVDEATSLVTGETVTGNYFELLGLRPVRGRLLATEDDRPSAPRVAVISSGLWERAFGRDPDVVGQTLYVRTLAYVIVGVAPPEFYGMPPIPGPDLWIPMTWIADLATMGISTWVQSPGETQLERRGFRWMFVKGRLREGVTLTQAAASLDVIMADLEATHPESNESQRLSLTLTNDVRLPPQVGGPVNAAAAGLMLAVGIVVLVACANVMGMLLARSVSRRREIALRLALGASRRRLVRQLVTEGLLLASLGAAGGLALAWGLLRMLATVESPLAIASVVLDFPLDARAFLFTAVVATGAGLLAALVPALQATRPGLLRDLNGTLPIAHGGGRRWFLRDALVAAQLAVTVPLLVLAGLSIRGASGSTAGAALGFEPDRVAAVGTNLFMVGYDAERADRFLRDALDRVRSMPGVEAAALTSRTPLDTSFSPRAVLVPGHHGPGDRGGNHRQGRSVAGLLPHPGGAAASRADLQHGGHPGVAPGRRRQRGDGPPLLAGGDRARAPVSADRLGRTRDRGRRRVRPTTRCASPRRHRPPTSIWPPRSGPNGRGRCSPGRAATPPPWRPTYAASSVARSRISFFLRTETLRETADVTVLPFRLAATVAGASGIVAALLGVVGLYGVIAYLVVRRTGEIAIRSALGARTGALLRHVLATGGWVVAVGLGSGAVLALVVHGVAARVAAGVLAADAVVWTGVLLLLVAVCAAAFVAPALRIVKLDVSRALNVP